MPAIKVVGFGGIIPALDKRLLPDNAATLAENCLLQDGSIIPLPHPTDLHVPAGGTNFAYRIPGSYGAPDFFYDSVWMDFADPDTSVIRGPIIDDVYDRYYFVSPSSPPKYNTRARIENGDPPWLLGVPAPTVAPAVVPSGGVSATLETRSYVYTYVTEYGEEGPPSPAWTGDGKIDATWGVTCTAPLSTDNGDPGDDRNIKKINIYRTVVGSNGVAVFYYVTQLSLPTVAYNDVLTGDVVADNAELESTNWSGPPADLDGFVVMPNGFLAGWRGNKYAEVWMSAPYRPHAWPAAYTQTLEYPIVGMGVTNQTLVVCTEAYPVTMQGTTPEFVSATKLTNHEPCAARGSILPSPEGVYYASPNGLVLVVPGRAENITKDIIAKRDWQQLVFVNRLRAARLGMAYFGYGSTRIGVFDDEAFDDGAFTTEDVTGALSGVVIDPTSQRVAFSTLKSDEPVVNCYNDPWSGEVFILNEGSVSWLDLVEHTDVYSTRWKSKVFQTTDIKNFSAVKVFFDTEHGGEGGEFLFYADGVLRATRTLERSGQLLRLPSGYKANFIQFEVTGKLHVLSVQIATSVKELANA